ncbi:Maf family protein [Flavobacteriales bacterium]|nr:Maf family protein [Flavobacteriales bacterium]MDA9863940.1 Maf family protein [Flavobacteriales bacterium]
MLFTPDTPSALPLLPGLQQRKLVLASASPRRKQLIGMLGIPFEIRPIGADEIYPEGISGPDIPRFLSELKARAAAPGLTDEEVLITSDTVVQLEGDTLEKPRSPEEAMDMIRRLSGRTHEVTTAFTIVDGRTPDTLQTDHDTVRVSFLHLSDEFIQHYVNHHQPFDKAGAYGAQDLIGACGIHTLEGSFYTVMGLPMHKIFSTLQALD